MADDLSQDSADQGRHAAPHPDSDPAAGHVADGGTSPLAAPQIGERREHPRHIVRVRVLVSDGQHIYKGRSDDLSYGGASLFIDSMLKPGTPLAIRLLTPHLKAFGHVDLNAKIQYCSLTSNDPPCRLGVSFAGMTAEGRGQLKVLIG